MAFSVVRLNARDCGFCWWTYAWIYLHGQMRTSEGLRRSGGLQTLFLLELDGVILKRSTWSSLDELETRCTSKDSMSCVRRSKPTSWTSVDFQDMEFSARAGDPRNNGVQNPHDLLSADTELEELKEADSMGLMTSSRKDRRGPRNKSTS